jgi:hypothetical protein
MDRHNHYEAAFEAFLRDRRMPYVAVDESKKALFSGSKLKSFDFVVYSRGGPNLLVDVKGRKALNDASLQTWATRRDVDDLFQWQRVFGEDFVGLFAFVYEVDPVLTGPPGHFVHRPGSAEQATRHYLMLGVGLGDYRNAMQRRSEKWDTVSLPAADFRQSARPLDTWL